MQTDKIQVGVIGAGGVAQSMIEAINLHPRTELAAICDVDAQRAQTIAEQYHVPHYVNHLDLLTQTEKLDLVYLAVPPKFHHAIALDILRHQKAILCEKPLANSLTEAKDMYTAAQATGQIHAMHFPTYYAIAFRQLWNHYKNGQLGTLQRVEVTARFPEWPRPWQQNAWIAGREQGGFVKEVFPHYIHLIQRLFGKLSTNFSQLTFPDDPKACETDFIAALRLENGTPVAFNAHSHHNGEMEILFTLYGDTGTLQLKNWKELWVAGPKESLRPIDLEVANTRLGCLSQVVNALEGNEADICDFSQGYEVQAVLESLLHQK